MPLIKSKFFSRYLPLTLSIVLLVFGAAVFLVLRDKNKTADAAWYSSSWTYRKPITIDKNKVSGVATSTHSNFPMLFSVTDTDLKYTSFGGKVGKTDGTDILFTSGDGSAKLSHEIEKYSSSTGETIIWVKIPLLSASSDTTIYIYFGNSGASDQQDVSNVWDSNYKGVWHLKDGNSLDTNDSTSNAFNLTQNGSPTAAAGKVDGGMGLNGSSQYGSRTNVTHNSGAITVSLWAKRNWTETPSIYRDTFAISSSCASDSGIGLSLSAQANNFDWLAKDILFYGDGYGSASAPRVIAASGLSGNDWHYITGVLSSSVAKIYVDGVELNPRIAMTNTVPSITANLNVGGYLACSGYNDGTIDEVKFSNSARSGDWIKTEYTNQTSPATFYAYGAVGVQARAASTGGVAVNNKGVSGLSWYSSSWTYRKPITIDKNKLSTTATTTFSNFPMLFSVTDSDLKYSSYGGKVGKADGTDIVFTSNDGSTKFSHEIEKYSSSTGETIIWVKIPLLSAASDTTIYIYFGNSGSSDQQDIANVWDSNYMGVWHLSEISGTHLDSTSNNNDSTAIDVATQGSAIGKIGGADDFERDSSDEIMIGQNSSLDISSSFTVSAWIKPESLINGQYGGIFMEGSIGNYFFEIDSNSGGDELALGYYDSGYLTCVTTASNLLAGNTYFVAGVFNSLADTLRIYINGSEAAPIAGNCNGATGEPDIESGTGSSIGSLNSTSEWFDGIIDDVRVSATFRSTDWIRTEYNNQSSPATFYSYGALGTTSRQDVSGGNAPTLKVRGGVKFR